MKHAVIVGSSGIVGWTLSRFLLITNEWKVQGIARTDYLMKPEGVELLKCDLLDKKAALEVLTQDKIGTATHLFFVAYIESGDEEKKAAENQKMLRNILEIMYSTSPNLKFVYLQTGTKYYGAHLGPKYGLITPSKENNPRLKGENLYYSQEDFLENFSKGKPWRWVVGRPPAIIGLSIAKAMNFGTTLAVYASILKELGQPLIFPYSKTAYHALREFVDVNLLCRFILWATNTPYIHGQAFNIANGDYIRTEQLWPTIASYFDMEYLISEKPFNLGDRMRDKGEVWEKIAKRNNLVESNLSRLVTWDFMQIILNREFDELTLTGKALEYGFKGQHLNTVNVFHTFFDALKNYRIIPQ